MRSTGQDASIRKPTSVGVAPSFGHWFNQREFSFWISFFGLGLGEKFYKPVSVSQVVHLPNECYKSITSIEPNSISQSRSYNDSTSLILDSLPHERMQLKKIHATVGKEDTR